jgi:hypothetical protein
MITNIIIATQAKQGAMPAAALHIPCLRVGRSLTWHDPDLRRPRPAINRHHDARSPPDVSAMAHHRRPTHGQRTSATARYFSASAPTAGYSKVYNIEMDPHEDLVVGGLFGWVSGPALKVVEEYLASVKKYPTPLYQPGHADPTAQCPLSGEERKTSARSEYFRL